MNIFKETPSYPILEQRRFWIGLSIVLTVVTVLLPFARKPNWGVDFAGGTELQVQFKGDVDAGLVREAVESAGIVDPNVQQFGDAGNHEFLVRVRRATLFTNEEFAKSIDPKVRGALPLAEGKEGLSYDENEGDQVTVTAKSDGALTADAVRRAFEGAQLRTQDVRAITEGKMYSVLLRGVSDKVETALAAKFADKRPEGGFLRRVEQVGASVGNELKVSAVKALVLSILLILLYIGFRFDFAFATGAVVSLIHDATLVIGYYLATGSELNTTTIAAVLTIIGYSVNDTVIIYDRIRENLSKHPDRKLFDLINLSVNETLSRSIITHLTVLLSLTGLVIFTVGTLREFSGAMFFGVVTGTYSSVYIASPVVLWMDEWMKSRRKAQEQADAAEAPTTPASGDAVVGEGTGPSIFDAAGMAALSSEQEAPAKPDVSIDDAALEQLVKAKEPELKKLFDQFNLASGIGGPSSLEVSYKRYLRAKERTQAERVKALSHNDRPHEDLPDGGRRQLGETGCAACEAAKVRVAAIEFRHGLRGLDKYKSIAAQTA